MRGSMMRWLCVSIAAAQQHLDPKLFESVFRFQSRHTDERLSLQRVNLLADRHAQLSSADQAERALFAFSAMAPKAEASDAAMAARALRSISISALFKPAIKRL